MENNAAIMGAVTSYSAYLDSNNLMASMDSVGKWARMHGLNPQDCDKNWGKNITSALAICKGNLAIKMAAYEAAIQTCLKVIEEAETIEELMEAKKDLMFCIVELPVRDDTCPYCILHKNDCDVCEYGKKYGICSASTRESKWWEMKKALDKLREQIHYYYDSD